MPPWPSHTLSSLGQGLPSCRRLERPPASPNLPLPPRAGPPRSKLADVILEVDGEKLPAHLSTLAQHSEKILDLVEDKKPGP